MIRLIGYGLNLLSPFFVHLQYRLDTLLVDEAQPGAPGGEEKKGFPTWAIILIVVVVLLCLGSICLMVFSPVLLALMGPSIGNVFSNMIEELETPAP